jgi:hypothetical protein
VKAIESRRLLDRRNVMKKLSAIAFFAIANLAMAGNSFAQTQAVKANIPFDFTVGQRLLPAGTYVIEKVQDSVITLKNLNKPIQIMGLTLPDSSVARGDSKLIFNRYGDQYFLSKVLSEQAGMDLRIPTSKVERRAQVQEARVKSATQTYVAAR